MLTRTFSRSLLCVTAVALLAATVLASYCAAVPALTGQVVNQANGQPLIGAAVTMYLYDTPEVRASTSTGDDGIYSFEPAQAPPGTYLVYASAEGGQLCGVEFDVAVTAGQTAQCDLSLAPSGALMGQITDGETRAELGGARAIVSLCGIPWVEAIADPHLWAVYSIAHDLPELPPGAPGVYRADASYPGYPQQKRYPAISSGNTAYVNFPLCTLMGQVASGFPGSTYSGATVSIYSPAGFVRAVQAQSPWGVYAFSPQWLSAGNYAVVASYDGQCQVKPVGVPGDWTKCLNFFALTPSATVSGEVKDAFTGQSVSGATVKAYLGAYLLAQSAGATYEFTGLPAGGYLLVASCAGYVDGSSTVTLTAGGTSSANLFLQPQ
jgi:hypothetical protein